MASNLTWSVSMNDRVSGPASRIGSQLAALTQRFKTLNTAASKPVGGNMRAPQMTNANKTGANSGGLFGKPDTNWISGFLQKLSMISPRAAQAGASLVGMAGRAQTAIGKLGPAISAVGSALGTVVEFAAKAALALAAVGIGLAAAGARFIVGMQSLKQSTVFAFAATMSGQANAIAGFDKMAASAIKIGAPIDEVAKAMMGLMAQGFSFDAADNLVKRMADLKALNPAANIDKIALAISQIKAKGKLSQEELSGQLAETGLSPDMVYEALAKKLGKDKQQIIKMISAGEIDSKTGIAAIEEAMKKQTGGGAAGAMAEKLASTTILGGIGRLTARVQAFAAGLKIDFAPVGAFLNRIGNVLQGDAGTRFGKSIENAFAKVLGILDGITEKDIATAFNMASAAIDAVASAASSVSSAVQTIDGWMTSIGAKTSAWSMAFEAVGGVISAVGGYIAGALIGPLYTVWGIISSLWGALSAFGGMIAQAFAPIGAAVAQLMEMLGVMQSLGGVASSLGLKLPGGETTTPAAPGATKNAGTPNQPTVETPAQIIKRVSEAKPPGSPPPVKDSGGDAAPVPPGATPGAGAAKPGGGATTHKVDVTTKVTFDTPMLRAIVTEIVKSEMGAGADAAT